MSDIDRSTLDLIAEQRDVAVAELERLREVLKSLHAIIDPKAFMTPEQQSAYRCAALEIA